MRDRFQQELDRLNTELVDMGNLCEEAIIAATRMLFCREAELRESITELKAQIEQKERDIETICMKLLLKQQPVAGDFRMISSALKMISHMQRIGDQADDIGEIVSYLGEQSIPEAFYLKELSDFTVGMVSGGIRSFVNQDLDLAQKTIADDDQVDGCFTQVKANLITAISDGMEVTDGQFFLDVLMIAKYLERIGDHAAGVAKWVVYSMTGAHPE